MITQRTQALKANVASAPRELRVNSNYITNMGQVALTEAIDMVQELGRGKLISVQF